MDEVEPTIDHSGQLRKGETMKDFVLKGVICYSKTRKELEIEILKKKQYFEKIIYSQKSDK